MDWKIKDVNKINLIKYMNHLKISEPMARILLAKGIDFETAKDLLNDPTGLFDIDSEIYGLEETAHKILQQKGKRIRIFADFDVDGLTSGFILNDYINQLTNMSSTVYFPKREEGYGLQLGWARTEVELAKKAGEELTVITIDNGITAFEAAEYLHQAGATVIIVDHHEPISATELPDADAICDAWVDRKYGTHLCAAAVAWKLVIRIASILSEDHPEEIDRVMKQYLPYAAIATVSDVMPSHQENYAIVQEGLRMMNEGQPRMIKALMNVDDIEMLRTKDIAWTIASELNACSRMGKIEVATKLLNLDSEDNRAFVVAAKAVKDVNKKRKDITKKATKEILENNDFSQDIICFVDGTDYPLGVTGLLAGKIAEEAGKPTVVYRRKEGSPIASGSARSIPGVSIKDLINYEASKGNAVAALGHAEACGVQLLVDKIDCINKDLIESGKVVRTEVVAGNDVVEIDTEIKPDNMTFNVRKEINSFGYTAKEIPLVGLINVKVEPLLWQTSSGKRHAIFVVKGKDKKDHHIVAWNGYDEYEALGKPERMNFAGSLDNGTYCRWFKGAHIGQYSTILIADKMGAA